MKNFFKNKNGFALLYALLLSGAVLSIGVILMNIITKQLVYSSVSRNSETSYYYLANSGRECLVNYTKLLDDNPFFTRTVDDLTGNMTVAFNSIAEINCLGQIDLPLTMYLSSSDDYPVFTSAPVDIGPNSFDLRVQFNKCRLSAGSLGCSNTSLIEKSLYVIRANGYSGSGDRKAIRSAFYIAK